MKYKLIKKNIMYNSSVLKVLKKKYKTSEGKKIIQEVVETWNGVGVISILPNKNIVLVKQYRTALDKETLEIPSGGVKNGENERDAIERELLEETGYLCNSVQPLIKFDVSPGYLTETVSIFVANIYKQTKQNLDEDEDIEVLDFSQEEILSLILNGQISDSKTLLALTYYFLFYSKK